MKRVAPAAHARIYCDRIEEGSLMIRGGCSLPVEFTVPAGHYYVRMQHSCFDEDEAWELEQSLGLGSREILVTLDFMCRTQRS